MTWTPFPKREPDAEPEEPPSRINYPAIAGLALGGAGAVLSDAPVFWAFAGACAVAGFVCGAVGLQVSRWRDYGQHGLAVLAVLVSVMAGVFAYTSRKDLSDRVNDVDQELQQNLDTLP